MVECWNLLNKTIALAHQPAPAGPEFKWSSEIWNLKSSPKTKFLLWKAMRGALPVGENLRLRGLRVEANCPFCGEAETPFHLFVKCQFATWIWDHAPFQKHLDPATFTSLQAFIEKAKTHTCLPPCGVNVGPLYHWIIWSIWITRNQRIFNDKRTNPGETLTQAISLAHEWNRS
ncbi:putative reverse transcriptase zinc-binding domain-containing protein [Arabidopsis thaliana]